MNPEQNYKEGSMRAYEIQLGRLWLFRPLFIFFFSNNVSYSLIMEDGAELRFVCLRDHFGEDVVLRKLFIPYAGEGVH